jgi:hypothetical protein
VTGRARTHSKPIPPVEHSTTERIPTIVADLDARVAAAAGVAPRPAGEPDMRAAVMNALDQDRLEPQSRGLDTEAIRRTGEHDVVDDGNPTSLMASVDPSELGLEAGASDAGASAAGATHPGGSVVGASDAGASDAGASDAGASDAGATHPGGSVVGASDAGASDAGASDVGASDAGATHPGGSVIDASDAGASDAGASDAGASGSAGDADPGGDGDRSPGDGGNDKPPTRRGWFRRRNKRP